MIKGMCHCGAAGWVFNGTPTHQTSCNCSICRRLGALWAYGTLENVELFGATFGYVQGDKTLAIHTCGTCGCTTHWVSLTDDGPRTRVAVNMRLADPDDTTAIPIRYLDGANTWEYIKDTVTGS